MTNEIHHEHDHGENCSHCAFLEEVRVLAIKGMEINGVHTLRVVACLIEVAMDLNFIACESPLLAIHNLNYGINLFIGEYIQKLNQMAEEHE